MSGLRGETYRPDVPPGDFAERIRRATRHLINNLLPPVDVEPRQRWCSRGRLYAWWNGLQPCQVWSVCVGFNRTDLAFGVQLRTPRGLLEIGLRRFGKRLSPDAVRIVWEETLTRK